MNKFINPTFCFILLLQTPFTIQDNRCFDPTSNDIRHSLMIDSRNVQSCKRENSFQSFKKGYQNFVSSGFSPILMHHILERISSCPYPEAVKRLANRCSSERDIIFQGILQGKFWALQCMFFSVNFPLNRLLNKINFCQLKILMEGNPPEDLLVEWNGTESTINVEIFSQLSK